MSSQFHSHLMRQIISTARHQARPPVALVGWINGDDANDSDPDSNDVRNHRGRRTGSTTADSLTATTHRRTPSTSSSSLSHPSSRPVLLQRRTSPGTGDGITPSGEDFLRVRSKAASDIHGSGGGGGSSSLPAAAAAAVEAPTASSLSSSSLYRLAADAQGSYNHLWLAAGPRTAEARSYSTELAGALMEEEEDDPPNEDEEDDGEVGDDPRNDTVARETEPPKGGPNLVAASAPNASEMVPAEELPRLFQDLILTRRTRSHFAPLEAAPPKKMAGNATGLDPIDDDGVSQIQEYWRMALDRAVVCGYAAPNHRRTEPFTFRRLLAPSAKTTQLADIAYEVHLRKQRLLREQQQQQQQQQATRVGSSSTIFDEPDAQAALRKRDKWNAIPAFLVATVASPSLLRSGGSDAANTESASERTRTNDTSGPIWYEPTPFVPPGTIRELEDYASCCAAVQNVLLSLHSEGIATKWATGDVIRTPAFRSELEIPDDERVVALVQVGHPAARAGAAAASLPSSAVSPPRRHRRQLKGDVLVDL